jgi:hypothetical protein
LNPGFKVFDPAITTDVAGRGTVASGTPTLISKETVLDRFTAGVAYQIVKTGNLAGTLTVEFSDANDDDNAAGARWDAYTITLAAIAGGTDPQGYGFEIPDFGHLRIRLKLVVSGGTGTFTARINVTERK